MRGAAITPLISESNDVGTSSKAERRGWGAVLGVLHCVGKPPSAARCRFTEYDGVSPFGLVRLRPFVVIVSASPGTHHRESASPDVRATFAKVYAKVESRRSSLGFAPFAGTLSAADFEKAGAWSSA